MPPPSLSLPVARNRAVRDALAARGTVPRDRLEAQFVEAESTGRPLGDLLRESGLLLHPELTAELSAAMACRVGAARRADRTARGLGLVETADLPAAGPARPDRDDTPELVSPDPFALTELDDLTFKLGRDATLVLGHPAESEGAPAPVGSARLVHHRLGAGGRADRDKPPAPAGLPADLLAEAARQPVVALVDAILHRAVRERASDIHFEPAGDILQVRFRVDGVLALREPIPAGLELAVLSRLKVLANLDIAERRLPQDGRLRLESEGRSVDLRLSTLPTWSGESLVLRVLDPGAVRTGLEELGLPAEVFDGLSAAIARPHGLVLVTGPTGAGKTTTLYAALRRLNQPGVRLITIEDPVEYEIDGVMQVAVNPAAGLGFGPALRAMLRQDPDVIMVGEIRDAETARIAVQAALTGHLVLSTLHTNDAVGAVTRLVDLGVEPYLVAAALEGVLAQRLVRRLDPATGALRGRTGVFEWMPVDDAWRDLVAAGATPAALRAHTRARGGRTLADEARRLVEAGFTTPDEAARVIADPPEFPPR
jgi:type IV pilus assembly protein PilB